MLILSRKKDEKLMIGNEIEVQIVKIGRTASALVSKLPAMFPYTAMRCMKASARNLAPTKSQLLPKTAFKNLLPTPSPKPK